jgi:hypothetical protein
VSQPGHDLIRAERWRQVHGEGYDAEHDAGHEEQLIDAAIAYALNLRAQVKVIAGDGPGAREALMQLGWPWAPEYWKPTGDTKRDLVKAGALIAAAIDALTAAEESTREVKPAEAIR